MGVEATDDFETAGLDITNFTQDQRYLKGDQMDVGARVPADDGTVYDDPESPYNDRDFEDVTEVRNP